MFSLITDVTIVHDEACAVHLSSVRVFMIYFVCNCT